MPILLKSSVEKLLGNNLEGLILPEKSVVLSPPFFIVAAILTALVLFLFLCWLKQRKQAKAIAKRELSQLSSTLKNAETAQDFAAQLSTILRKGLGIQRLDNYKAQDKNAWQSFSSSLETACYSGKIATKDELQTLLEQTRFWLDQA